MDETTAKALREPFAADVIGKLPRVTCRDCSQRSCQKHQKSKCAECSNYISTAHIHLSYVGHAAITDRLLAVDPTWVWEPVAFDADGLPALDRNGGLWIRLTVAEVTRLGYGDAQGKNGPDAVKEAIGDALRNAAMRFGVGLDLWHKDGQLVHDDQLTQSEPQRARQRSVGESVADKARAELRKLCDQNGWPMSRVAAQFEKEYDQILKTTDDAALVEAFTASLVANAEHVLRDNG